LGNFSAQSSAGWQRLIVARYPMKAQLTFTYGGLKCDLDSRVLSTTGTPIPGRDGHVVVPIRMLISDRSVLCWRAERFVL
jgi:hypothetical protein